MPTLATTYCRFRALSATTFATWLAAGGPAVAQETAPDFWSPDSVGAPLANAVRMELPEPFMRARIHFFSTFIERFNAQTDLAALFDADDTRLNPRQPGYNAPYAARVAEFLADMRVLGPAARLVAPDTNLYADVTAQVAWEGLARPVSLYLKKVAVGRAREWQLLAVVAPFLPAPVAPLPAPDSVCWYVAPNAHELNFMALTKALRAGRSLGQIAHPAASVGVRTVDHYVATGQLRWQTTLATTLWLDTGLGWWLQLRSFGRETDASGWLISDVCPAAEAGTYLPPALRAFGRPSPPKP